MTSLSVLVPPPSLPPTPNFSGHETFAFRYAWLKKGVDGLSANPDVFLQDDALIQLGVGKNMVRSIRHWCLATRVVAEGEPLPGNRAKPLIPTDFGRSLFLEPGWDAYLEDDTSLWLIHWSLATNPALASTWYWAFNILNEQEFTRESLVSGLERIVEAGGGRTSLNSLKADVSCFLRTYVAIKRGPSSTLEETLDCPLSTLGLISEVESDKRYRFTTVRQVVQRGLIQMS